MLADGTAARALPDPIAEALLDFRRRVEAEFGDRLVDLRLFGSWARGAQDDASDVDVLVVIRGLQPLEHSAVWRAGTRVFCYRGVDVAPLPCSPERWQELVDRELLIAADIASQGVPF